MVTFKNTTRGFTLIELMVVITIIGILAIGGTIVYTSQIQKARDTTRISDITSMVGAIEQYYGDQSIYPANVSSGTLGLYASKIPLDSKNGQKSSGSGKLAVLGYAYAVGADAQGNVDAQRYEVATAFENAGNVDAKAINTKDSGNDENRWEKGIPGSGGILDLTSATGAWKN